MKFRVGDIVRSKIHGPYWSVMYRVIVVKKTVVHVQTCDTNEFIYKGVRPHILELVSRKEEQ